MTAGTSGTAEAEHRVAAVLSNLPQLAGKGFALDPLPGGLTNQNFAVSVDGVKQYVARYAGAKTALLAIDRAAEFRNATAAAAAGIGPRIVEYAPADEVLLVEWISGRTFADADLDDPAALERVAAACRQLHSASRFGNDFDMFTIQRRYLRIVAEHGFRLPADYRDYEPQVRRAEAALRASAAATVPCHNDLLAANIMDDGSRLWIIDYEYSGNNDPCFELGNVWSEAALAEDRLEHLVTSYFGTASAARTARARLFALMSKYGWTLWASIQDGVSTVDFDFWGWGMEKYHRAVAEFRGPGFDTWIHVIEESLSNEGAAP